MLVSMGVFGGADYKRGGVINKALPLCSVSNPSAILIALSRSVLDLNRLMSVANLPGILDLENSWCNAAIVCASWTLYSMAFTTSGQASEMFCML